jgi:zinc protease
MTRQRSLRLHAIVLVGLTFWAMATSGLAADLPKRVPELPAALQASVDQVLQSRPGDLFAVLNNGLTVLIRQQQSSEAVSAKIFVKAGSLYEGKFFLGGLSHYLEHVVAGGSTRSFSEAEAKERLRRIGGATNAYTSYDRTVYYIDTTTGHWHEALKLLISFVSENELAPAEVEREKGVIQQEFKLGENNLRRLLWELFLQTAYQRHPVRNPVIGLEEVFVRQDREALAEYYAARYQPQNMVLAVVGNVDPLKVLQMVVEETKDFQPRSARPSENTPEPPQINPRWREKELPMARLTQVMIGFPSVALTDPDMYALDVLAMVLGDGETSRLYRRLKDQERKVLSVTASNWTPAFVSGQFMITLGLPAQNWPGVLASVEQEIDRFKTTAVAPRELAQAKKQVIAQHVFDKQTASSLASSLGSSYLDTADPYFDEAYVEGIRRVTPEKIREVANRYLTMDRSNVAVIKPTKAEPAPQDAAAPAAEAAKPSSVAYTQPQNGLKVLLKQDRSLPLVTIQLYGLGGLLLEEPKQMGLARFTAALLTAGTPKRSKLAIAQAIEGAGGSIGSSAGNSTYNVSIKVLKEDLDLALDILADIAQNAQFPQTEIDLKRQEFLLAILRQDEDWQHELLRLFKSKYFQQNPYGHDALGTTESVESFSRADVLAFYRRMVNPAQSALAVYGDIPLDKVLRQIQVKFSGWKAAPVALPDLPEATSPLSADQEVERTNEKTSAALFVGTAGLAIDASERPALDVLDALLSGVSYPSGRLQDALRGGTEDLVYVVHGFPFYGIKAGYFGVITQTTLAHLPKVQEIIVENLDRLRTQAVPVEELQTGKDLVITMHQLHLESLDAQAQSAVINEALGLGWNYDERYPELIRAVQAEDVQRVAEKLFTHKLLVRTVPEKPVEALIQPQPAKRLHPY